MKNWSTDIQHLKKHPSKYHIWKLEQLINFGLSGEKIQKEDVKKYFGKLNIDPGKREFLKLILK